MFYTTILVLLFILKIRKCRENLTNLFNNNNDNNNSVSKPWLAKSCKSYLFLFDSKPHCNRKRIGHHRNHSFYNYKSC